MGTKSHLSYFCVGGGYINCHNHDRSWLCDLSCCIGMLYVGHSHYSIVLPLHQYHSIIATHYCHMVTKEIDIVVQLSWKKELYVYCENLKSQ